MRSPFAKVSKQILLAVSEARVLYVVCVDGSALPCNLVVRAKHDGAAGVAAACTEKRDFRSVLRTCRLAMTYFAFARRASRRLCQRLRGRGHRPAMDLRRRHLTR